ncbi:MAG: Na/Pi symporter [Candidatus Polarisedimenticolaceae bacterium]|nr:Na/Pi symporter [Candidatus Polarisedimenticolaceae bacterium]
MIRKIILPTIFLLLAYGFWLSPDFKEISAGVAIFLFGMLVLERGFKAFTGGSLEHLLRSTTNQLWKSISFGFVSTALMQSSSLVSLITISFLSAELISLAAGIGIIFGANIGTTAGAWLIAAFGLKVKLSIYAMPMLVFGVILIFQKSKSLSGMGYILTALGFLFLGIHHMKEGFDAFKQTLDLSVYAVPGYRGLFLYTLIGLLATVVMQSSHATLVLILTALASQQISYDNAIALAIGSNIGTTITAILGSLSANVDGKRLAAAHLIFNLITGLLTFIFIHQLISVVDVMSQLMTIAPDNYTMKLALFHTLFNLLGVLTLMPFINRMVTLLEWLFPTPVMEVESARYLTDASAEIPDAAVEAVKKETVILYDHAVDIIIFGLGLNRDKLFSDEAPDRVIDSSSQVGSGAIDDLYERRIKTIYGAIVEFTSHVHGTLSDRQSNALIEQREAGHDIIEVVKGIKHLQKNLAIYQHARNSHICGEYDQIRLKIARILKALNALQHADDETASVLSLDHLKVEISKKDIFASGGLDSLIRKKQITAPMAISLMNDTTYCNAICRNLIHIGERIFVARDPDDKAAEQSVALDEREISEVIERLDERKLR